MTSKNKSILPHALKVPGLNKLHGKRVVLASNSPRRKEILETFVRGAILKTELQIICNHGVADAIQVWS